MILNKEQILSTFSILMSRHETTIKALGSKASLSSEENMQLRMAHEALETYKISKNKIINNWSK
jgi:hypothetical protein